MALVAPRCSEERPVTYTSPALSWGASGYAWTVTTWDTASMWWRVQIWGAACTTNASSRPKRVRRSLFLRTMWTEILRETVLEAAMPQPLITAVQR